VNGELRDNEKPVQKLDAKEDIVVHTIAIPQLPQRLQGQDFLHYTYIFEYGLEWALRPNCIIDAKVHAIAMGLCVASAFHSVVSS